MEQPLLVYTTFGDTETALAIGEELVREKLCACVNVLPGMRSVYAWKGSVEHGHEVIAILKTRQTLGDALSAALKAKHPYETPIIISLTSTGADRGTTAWLFEETLR